MLHRLPARDVVVGVDLLIAPLGHRADVRAGGEGLVVAGDDDRADAGIGVERGQGHGKLGCERVVERVHPLRSIEADHPDPAKRFNENVAVVHRGSGRLVEVGVAATSSRAAAIAVRNTSMLPM